MEMVSGKLFIGGISWNTTEERLRDYFQTYGEVLESVIMKDRTTGRARGFGFIVFANASVAEEVEKERHVIDGRAVEAKKAVPRDDHHSFNRNNVGNIPVCPSPIRTKKIFVGGLASTITETDFKRYFNQFGIITDVVVMYDHITQRPRGFGFITYDSYEAVDNVLVNNFHELNGKTVEVKRAVPKESSPGPTYIQPGCYNYGLYRLSSLLTASNQGYNSCSTGGYGMRVHDHFSPLTVDLNGYPPYSPFKYSMDLNLDSGFSLNNELIGNSGLGYEHGIINSNDSGNFNRYRGSMRYDADCGGSGSFLNATKQNMWSNGSLNYTSNSGTSNIHGHPGSGNTRIGGRFGSIGEIFDSSPVSAKVPGSGSLGTALIDYGNEENIIDGGTTYARGNGGVSGSASYFVSKNILEPGIGHLCEEDSLYAWHSPNAEVERSSFFSREHGTDAANFKPINTVGYVGEYNITTRANRGIAA